MTTVKSIQDQAISAPITSNKTSTPSPATNKAGSDTPQQAPLKRDAVELSSTAMQASKQQEAAKAAAQTGDKPVAVEPATFSIPKNAERTTLATAQTASGRTVSIESYDIKHAGVETADFIIPDTYEHVGYVARIIGADGKEEQSFIVSQDMMFTEDKNGNLTASSYQKGQETDGDDIIVGAYGNDLSGGAGDDTIIEISSDQRKTDYYGPHQQAGNIDTGDGDDTVILSGKLIFGQSINTGNGDDTIISNGEIRDTQIDTGDGDDTIKAKGIVVSSKTVSTGTGDDSIIAEDFVLATDSGIIATGSGDDTIAAGSDISAIYSGVISTGDGDDTLNSDAWIDASSSGVISTGDGDDTLNSDAWISADYSGVISTGDGDDTLDSGSWIAAAYSGVISTGDGDDTLDSGSWVSADFSGVISTGNGNDHIGSGTWITTSYGGTISMGAGDDSLISGGAISGNGRIYMGSGNDFVKASAFYGVTIFGGDGNDIFVGGSIFDSTLDMGAGDDYLIAGSVTDSSIRMGSGNNTTRIQDKNKQSLSLKQFITDALSQTQGDNQQRVRNVLNSFTSSTTKR